MQAEGRPPLPARSCCRAAAGHVRQLRAAPPGRAQATREDPYVAYAAIVATCLLTAGVNNAI
jgi:hypothetical protein